METANDNAKRSPLRWPRSVLLALTVGLTACGGPELVVRVDRGGEVATGAVVVLDASASTSAPGATLRFEWRQIAGPRLALEGAGESIARFTVPAPAAGAALELELAVEDDQGRRKVVPIVYDVVPVASTPSVLLFGASPGELGPASSVYVLRAGESAPTRMSPDPATLSPGEFVWVRSVDTERAVFTVGDQLFTYDFATNERVEVTLRITQALGFADFRQFSFSSTSPVIYVVGTREGRDGIVAFELDANQPRVVYEVPVDGTARIGDIPGHGADPYPDPAGARLAFMLEQPEAGTAELVTVPASGGAPSAVSGPVPLQAFVDGWTGGIGTFSWSPDAKRIVYTADVSSSMDYQTFAAPVEAPAPAPKRVVPALPDGRLYESYYGARARWTPDSAALVFEAEIEPGKAELFVTPPDVEGGERRLHPPFESGTSITRFGWTVSASSGAVLYQVQSETDSGPRFRWYGVDPAQAVAPAAITPELAEETYISPAPDGSDRYVYLARLEDGSQALHLSGGEAAGAALPISISDPRLPELVDYVFRGPAIVYLRGRTGEEGGRALRRIDLDDPGSSDRPIDVPLEADEMIARWAVDADAGRIFVATERVSREGLDGVVAIDTASDRAARLYVHDDPSVELIGFQVAWP